MFDFLRIKVENHDKKGSSVVSPKFLVGDSEDLMIRGRDFYAIWDEEKGLWSTSETRAIRLIDAELRKYVEENKESLNRTITVRYLRDSTTGAIDDWHKYVQRQMRDNYVALDSKMIFRNTETKKEDYASKKLSYDLADGDISAYEEMMSTLFNPDE